MAQHQRQSMRAVRVPADLLRDVAASLPPLARAEMAIPSYGHWNPLVRWLFWARLDAALRLANLQGSETVVDFASGTGVFVPTLAKIASIIITTDLYPEPTRALAATFGLPVQAMALEAF